ncbi:MAG: hypothetical protein A3F10_06405 [Coxiella sp. RIFCSPHIGHO2_12_FULL_42_15]|nr:MAG: hypothetical protein A3F10_06405 [Coxiella sp. RIFCSPHIGHO2_12_FULL_42_15]
MKKVLVLGGYGNFGQRIVLALAKEGITTVIAGRNRHAAEKLVRDIKQVHPHAKLDIAIFEIEEELNARLEQLAPTVVIDTSGPFQSKDHRVAELCIHHHIHYLDLADGRDFVNQITVLNEDAKNAGVLVVSGVSTVPGLSSAVIEHFKNEFQHIDSLIYGISPGQKTPRGLATTAAILSYLGKPLNPAPEETKIRYGWQNLYRQKYPILGKRWMANCDIPDVDLFSKFYNIKQVRFSGGMESAFVHLCIWGISWLVRLGLPLNLINHARFLCKLSHRFDWLGTTNGGMHMILKGVDTHGKTKQIEWYLIAKDGDGLQVPTVPAVILAKKLIAGEINTTGAMPCVGLVSLEEYLHELKEFHIQTLAK